MKKKIAFIQMQAVLAGVETNYRHAEELMEQAMEGNPDILVLPETWNTGFYISRKLKSIADEGGKRTETFLSSFAKKHHVNVVGGSTAVLCGDDVYNRSFVFDREGRKIAEYDKVHGFSYAYEPMYFKGGDHAVSFTLDDISCSMVICYDIRFPELVRRSVLEGKADLFFIPAAWPKASTAAASGIWLSSTAACMFPSAPAPRTICRTTTPCSPLHWCGATRTRSEEHTSELQSR